MVNNNKGEITIKNTSFINIDLKYFQIVETYKASQILLENNLYYNITHSHESAFTFRYFYYFVLSNGSCLLNKFANSTDSGYMYLKESVFEIKSLNATNINVTSINDLVNV